jgi:tetratricopeptide (TPR) repeat protein
MNDNLRNSWALILRRLRDPRILAVFLFLFLFALLVYQYFVDPYRSFLSGLEGTRINNTSRVRLAIDLLEREKGFVLQRKYLLAWNAVQEGRFQDALRLADESKTHPDVEVEARVVAGQAAYRIGAAGNAQSYWEEALALNPDALEPHRWLGVLYFDLGAMDNALIHLRAVSKLDPTDFRAERLMGLINRDYERPEAAIVHYQESLRRSPSQPDRYMVCLELAECQIKQRNFEAAIESLTGCPDSPRRNRLLARCLLNLASLDQARNLAEISLSLEPFDLDALQLNAEIALADGNISKASGFLRLAVDKHPYSHSIRAQFAQVLGRLGNTKEAQQEQQRAEELQTLWQRFSDLQIEAINRPIDAQIRYEIGLLANRLGKADLAASWFRAALAINPNFILASEALGDLQRS